MRQDSCPATTSETSLRPTACTIVFYAMSLMVLGRENWSHQLEISRNACIKLRLERDACPRNTAHYCPRAIPEPPSRKLMTVSSCSMPSISGSIAAPTRDGSSPSSFANVLQKLSSLSCAKCKAVHLHAIHSEYLQYGHPISAHNPYKRGQRR